MKKKEQARKLSERQNKQNKMINQWVFETKQFISKECMQAVEDPSKKINEKTFLLSPRLFPNSDIMKWYRSLKRRYFMELIKDARLCCFIVCLCLGIYFVHMLAEDFMFFVLCYYVLGLLLVAYYCIDVREILHRYLKHFDYYKAHQNSFVIVEICCLLSLGPIIAVPYWVYRNHTEVSAILSDFKFLMKPCYLKWIRWQYLRALESSSVISSDKGGFTFIDVNTTKSLPFSNADDIDIIASGQRLEQELVSLGFSVKKIILKNQKSDFSTESRKALGIVLMPFFGFWAEREYILQISW